MYSSGGPGQPPPKISQKTTIKTPQTHIAQFSIEMPITIPKTPKTITFKKAQNGV
jgi:hypothetical protein